MGKLRQGGVTTYLTYMRTRTAELALCPISLPWSSGVSHPYQEAPQVLGVKFWVRREKLFLLFKGHDYLVNICADNS